MLNKTTATASEKPTNQRVPERVSVSKMVGKEAQVKGVLPIASMSRLVELLANDSGSVDVDVEFVKDDQGRRVIRGLVDASVVVFCQRCLEPMPLQLKHALDLVVVTDEEKEAELPSGLEPVLVEDDELDLHAVVEDELLLALPIVSSHTEECGERAYIVSPSNKIEAKPMQKPFQDLASMLGKQ